MNDIDQFNKNFDIRLRSVLSNMDNEKAIEDLEQLKKEFETYYDINSNIISTNNPLEYIIDLNLNKDKPKKLLPILAQFIYYFLGLRYQQVNSYEEAENCFKMALKLNPYYFECVNLLCTCYKETKEYNKIYDTLKENDKYIYNSEQLSSYYSLYGDYLFYTRLYDDANILYSYSEMIKSSSYNQSQLSEVAKISNRLLIKNTEKEINTYLNEHDIMTNISKEIMMALLEIYNKDVDSEFEASIKSEVKTILYERTKNDIFAQTSLIKSELGFSFNMPEDWSVIREEELNDKSLLYLIKTTSKDTISIINNGKIINNDIRNNYSEYRKQFVKEGLFILNERVVAYNRNKFIQVLVEKKILNESVVEVHNYIAINDICLDIVSIIDMDNVDLRNINKNNGMKKINILLSSFKINENNTSKKEEFTFY